MKESKITLPHIAPCIIITMYVNCETLVIGWIKKLFANKEFKDLILPPIYLLKMISLWYDQEMVHWFTSETTRCCNFGNKQNVCYHQKIALKHILSNL